MSRRMSATKNEAEDDPRLANWMSASKNDSEDGPRLANFFTGHYFNSPMSLMQSLLIKCKEVISSMSAINLKATKQVLNGAHQDTMNSGDNHLNGNKKKSEKNERSVSLLKITEVPHYLRFNPWIRSGYRPPNLSTLECIQSMSYLHNETINILTHAIPLVYLLVFYHKMIPWQRIELKFLAYLHFAGCVSPWLGSSVYHLFMNHKNGEKAYYRLLQWDVIGIWVTQSFGASTTIYASVVLYPVWFQYIFIGLYVILSVFALRVGVLADMAWKRPASFSFLFLMRLIAIILRINTISLRQKNSMQLFHVAMQEIWPLVGAFISTTRIPERFWPGLFDFYFNSHNIMHCFVVFGAVHMHWATFDDLLWLSSNNININNNNNTTFNLNASFIIDTQ